MGGCTNCKGKSGCDHRKGAMLGEIEEWLERLYPTRVWGEMDDELALDSGVSEEDGLALAEELAQELKAAAIYRPGGDADLCDYLYLLCMGREPCLLQMRDGEVPMDEETRSQQSVNERYLRVSLSNVAPLAVVQEVSVEMRQVDGAWVVSEEARAGVYDAPLLKRFQRLVSLLPAYGITHLDMGEIDEAPEGYSSDAYRELYGEPAQVVNYFFFRSPSTYVSTETLPTTT